MLEKNVRSFLVKNMQELDAKPIENHVGIGTPDMNFIGGWFECKYMESWPKNADISPVRLKHPLSPEQGVWLYRRCRLGGSAWVALRIADDWLFINGLIAKDVVGKSTRPELFAKAEFKFYGHFNKDELIGWLRTSCLG